jgi:large-conductance mechanosensitive channel
MTRRLRAFAMFLWDFVVGDDWRLAVGVVAGLALTAVVAGLGVTAWWLLPVLAAAMLAASVWRASRLGE